MELPIDFRNAPIKPKYLDEETPMFARWFIWGEYSDGTVDVVSGSTDIFDRVPREKALRIVAARETFCNAVLAELNGS